jgi:hypothetical protein
VTRAEFLKAAARYSFAAVGITALAPSVVRPAVAIPRPVPSPIAVKWVTAHVDGLEIRVREESPEFPWSFLMLSMFDVHTIGVSCRLTPRARRRVIRKSVRAIRRGKRTLLGACFREGV